MKRKLVFIILFSAAILIIALLSGSDYWRSTKNQAALNSQQQTEKASRDFPPQSKKFPQTNEEVSLIAVGDVSYSRGVERVVKKQGDIYYPLLKMRDYLKGADLVFGNLETPITQGREISGSEMTFRSNPGTEHALRQAGFSVMSLANNHTPNFGEKGLQDTFGYLDKVGIKYVGAGKNEQEAYQPLYIETKEIKFAFLAYNDPAVVPASYEAGKNRAGTAFIRIEKMTEAVRGARQNADFVIVSMHAGTEYTQKPNGSQVNFARGAIDAGADLIIGHHPHVVQTMEKYKGKYIFYSLGNFVFDQFWSQETKRGLAIKAYFTKNELSKISLLPVAMDNSPQPRPANNSEAEKILKRLNFPIVNRIIYEEDPLIVRLKKSAEEAIVNIK